MSDRNKKSDIKDKKVIIDLFVLWLALTALSCAAINLHISLNKLGKKRRITHINGVLQKAGRVSVHFKNRSASFCCQMISC